MDEIKNLLIQIGERLGITKASKEIEEEMVSIEVVYEPDVKDAHNQWMSAETIAKGCENFNLQLEAGKIQPNLYHLTGTDKFSIEKTWIQEEFDVTVDATGEQIKQGTWIAKLKYHDKNLWELKKSGVVQGVSIFGYGNINEETGEITNLTFEEQEDATDN